MKNIIAVLLGTVGLLLLFVGIYQVFTEKKSSESVIQFEENEITPQITEIVVDVEGAVITPGVYKLTSDKRMVDALAMAGGLSSDADRDWVEKNINLAGKLTDGLKIYIPRMGEEVLSESSKSANSAVSVININLASSSDLESLPGIGEVTAQKIVDGRPYSSPSELLEKKIVGSATYEKIKDKIAVN
jgi:competence protein ComEA